MFNLHEAPILDEVDRYFLEQNFQYRGHVNWEAIILKQLHDRYSPKSAHDDVETCLNSWIDELIQYGILKRDSEEASVFVESMKKFVTHKQDDFDRVEISGHYVMLRNWDYLSCVIQAIKDDSRFKNPNFQYPQRLTALYHNIAIELTSCTKSIRTAILSVLNFEYIEDDGEPLYVFNSIEDAVHQQMAAYFENKLSDLLESTTMEDRQLGFRILRQWLKEEYDTIGSQPRDELDHFRNVIPELTDHIGQFIEIRTGVSRQSPVVTRALAMVLSQIEYLNCPLPRTQREAATAFRQVTQNPALIPREIRQQIEKCQELGDVTEVLAPLERKRLEYALLKHTEMLAVGEVESRQKSEAQRIQGALNALSPDENPDKYLVKLKSLCEEFTQLTSLTNESNSDSSFFMETATTDASIKTFHMLLEKPELALQKIELSQLYESLRSDQMKYTVFNLSRRTVNRIFWHAIRASMAKWSNELQWILRELLNAMQDREQDMTWIRATYLPAFATQLEWMLVCAGDKKWRSPPDRLCVPCNASHLQVREGEFTDKHTVDTQLMSPLDHRAWWLGLPGELTLADLPCTPEDLSNIWSRCSLEQILHEFDRALPGFRQLDDKTQLVIYTKLPTKALIEIIIEHWETISPQLRLQLFNFLVHHHHWSDEFCDRVNAKISDIEQLISVYHAMVNTDHQLKLLNSHLDLLATSESRIKFFRVWKNFHAAFVCVMEHVLDPNEFSDVYLAEVDISARPFAQVVINGIRLRKWLAVCPEKEDALSYLRRVGGLELLESPSNANDHAVQIAVKLFAEDDLKPLNQEQVRLYLKVKKLIIEFDVTPINAKEEEFVASLDGLSKLKSMLTKLEFDSEAITECESLCRDARKDFDRKQKIKKLFRASMTGRADTFTATFMCSNTTQKDHAKMIRAFHKTPRLTSNDITDINRRLNHDSTLSRYAFQRIVVHAFRISPANWSAELIELLEKLVSIQTPWLEPATKNLVLNQLQLLMESSNSAIVFDALATPLVLPCKLNETIDIKMYGEANRVVEAINSNLTYYFDWRQLAPPLSDFISLILKKSPIPLFLALERADPQDRMMIVQQYFQYTEQSVSVIDGIKSRLPKSDHEAINQLWLSLKGESGFNLC